MTAEEFNSTVDLYNYFTELLCDIYHTAKN